MQKDRILAELVFDLANGNLILDEGFVPQSDIVQNEFAEGSDCAAAYSRMLDAYSRLCARLGVSEWEDDDVEIIIDAPLQAIGKHLALTMFDYGMYYGGWKTRQTHE